MTTHTEPQHRALVTFVHQHPSSSTCLESGFSEVVQTFLSAARPRGKDEMYFMISPASSSVKPRNTPREKGTGGSDDQLNRLLPSELRTCI